MNAPSRLADTITNPLPDSFLRQLVGTPGVDDYPSIFWKWNADLDQQQLRKQVVRFAEWGIRSLVIHPMPDDFRKNDFYGGMTTPYLSPQYFQAVRAAVEAAAEHDLRIWLFDEGGWPSGRANGKLLAQHPHLRSQVMTSNGLNCPDPTLPDLLNAETAQRFIELTYAPYRDSLGPHFGTTVPGMFIDEPSVPGRTGTDCIPWTDDLPKEFQKQTGQSLLPLLPMLFRNGDSESERTARIAFNQVWSKMFRDRFLFPVRAWCEANGVTLVGHFLGDQSLRGHARCTGNMLENCKALHEPGIDVIWKQIDGERPRGFFPLFASSAGQRGKHCWSESFAVYGFGLPIREMKLVADYQLLQGITKFAMSYCQLATNNGRGMATATRRLDDAPDAAHYPDLDVYLARLGSMLRRADVYTPVRVPYPIADLWGQYGRKVSNKFNEVSGALADRSIGYRFADDARWQTVDEWENEFWAAWPYPLRPQASRAIRWLAFTADGKPLLFAVNVSRHTAFVTLNPGAVRYRLEAGESRLLNLEHAHPDPRRRTITALRDWQMTPLEQWLFDGDKWVPEHMPTNWQTNRMLPWRQLLNADFSGTCQYRTAFRLHQEQVRRGNLWLELGDVRYAAEVHLNGQSLGRRAWPPYRFALRPALEDGTNELTVTVSGSLANQAIAPEVTDALKAAGRHNLYLQRAEKFERNRLDSGLLGPVKIVRLD